MKLAYLLVCTGVLLTSCIKTAKQPYDEAKQSAQQTLVLHPPLGFGFHSGMTVAEAEAHKKRVFGTSATTVSLSTVTRKPDELILDYYDQHLVYVGASFHGVNWADYIALRQVQVQRYGDWLADPDDCPSWFSGPVEIYLGYTSSPEGYRLRLNYTDVHQGKQYTVESRQKRIEEFKREVVKEDSSQAELIKKDG
jgi:hypothetical protein